jgi:predicted HTH domain antitoxin
MVITLELPDDIAHALTERSNQDLTRRALEALAVQGYAEERLTQRQVGELLGLGRIETEDFLAQHVDLYDYDPAELTREADSLRRFSERAR